MSGRLKVNEIIPSADLLLDGNVVVNGTLSSHNINAAVDFAAVTARLEALETRCNELESAMNSMDGKIINITIHENDVRRVLQIGSPIELDSFGVDKKSSTSILLINGTISGYGSHSGTMTQKWEYGVESSVNAQSVMYDETGHAKIYSTSAVINNHSITGYQKIALLYFNNDETPTHKPFNIYNPNSTEHAHLGQTKSVYTVYEIEQSISN